MKKSKKTFLFVFSLTLLSFMSYKYVYHEHRNIATEQVKYTIHSENLLKDFKENSIDASKKYLNNVIAVTGKITDKEKGIVTLTNGICCLMASADVSNFSKNEMIKIKGRCIGYDDLLELVKIDQSVVLN
ncbi:MAG: OB-fold protein [Lutibacter sp.]